eukprot:Skav209586  [mRNA]  locus=scaffold1607:39438:42899:+ [translate_table: standard]
MEKEVNVVIPPEGVRPIGVSQEDPAAEAWGASSEDEVGCPVNLCKLNLAVAKDLNEWADQVKLLFGKSPTFGDLGRYLGELAASLPTPLGNFIRSFGTVAQPTSSQGKRGDHGDLLPIAPWKITIEIEGVTEQNLDWVKLLVVIINFHYCSGWGKPICVPFADEITALQKKAVTKLALVVTQNIITAFKVMSLGECEKLLTSKKYDYAGRPVEYMQDLECHRVLPAWPQIGHAAVAPIEEFLEEKTRQELANPRQLLLAKEKMPYKAKRSKVRATDHEWFKIVQAAHKRGMMMPVHDDDVPRDREGHLIVNGAGGVVKEKVIDGKTVQCQRFISVLCPINDVTTPITGSQDTLPFIGQLSGIVLEDDESLYLESEDLQSAFNLFKAPRQWRPFFAYSKKVDGWAFDLAPGTMVRPALSVIPMGWHSAVALVQEAVRDLVFRRAGVPRNLSVEKNKPLPAGKSLAVVYLDNFDEIEIIKDLDIDLSKEGKVMSDHHQRFIEACDEARLPRNGSKQLIHAFAGGMQGGEFDGRLGVLKLGSDKLRNYIQVCLGLLARKKWGEFQLRHWTGKSAFMATFRRSIFSGMSRIFELIEQSRKGDVLPTASCVDEVFVLMVQSVASQVNLKARISPVVSCTDASPYGGGSGVATLFTPDEPEDPPAEVVTATCATCQRDMTHMEPDNLYQCPAACGDHFCSVACFAPHRLTCGRQFKRRFVFGERFSGPRFPLTKAMALEGIFVQPPLDILIPGDEWDFFTPGGKERLDAAEDEGSLFISHWGPECKTFSAARGRPIRTTSGRWINGPPALRSRKHPWGLPNLKQSDQVHVRRGNGMAKRALQGMREALHQERYGTLEHPWNSHLWWTDEAEELQNLPGVFVTCFSHCCFGGHREKWTRLVHNVPFLHTMLHKEWCDGHDDLLPYEVHDEDGDLRFDTAEEAEYPWLLCRAWSQGIAGQLLRQFPAPDAGTIFDEEGAILQALKTSTKGFQNESLAQAACEQILAVAKSMEPQTERQHLRWLMTQVALRGSDIKMLATPEDGSRSSMIPYPAYKWQWETKLSYPWRSQQHINILEVSAFLTEYRRRLRSSQALGTRFFNVTDSQVMFHCLTKGRSSSPRLNRLLRRVNALILVSECLPMHLRTISKWNFADRPSRRFDPR